MRRAFDMIKSVAAALAMAGVLAACLAPNSWARQGVGGVTRLLGQIASSQAPTISAAVYAPSVTGVVGLREIPYRYGALIDEVYRRSFLRCDRANAACKRKPNRTKALIELPSGALFMEAHLNLDLTGSKAACEPKNLGLEPLFEDCATMLDYEGAPLWAYNSLRAHYDKLFLNNEQVPFVAIPLPPEGVSRNARAFPEKTGVQVGDIGVAFYRDRFTPVIVGAAGPGHQSLAGSLGLFEALGVSRCKQWADAEKTRCALVIRHGLGDNVVVVLFPGSRLGGLTPETVNARMRDEAFDRLQRIVGRQVAANTVQESTRR